MGTINPIRAGLVFASLLGGWHLLWSVLVALQLAQPVIDFIFWLHFVKPVYVVEEFDIGRAIVLLAVTSLIGGALGYCFGRLWNWLHK